MDAFTPSLSNPAPTSRRDVVYAIAILVLLALVLGGTLWYAMKNKPEARPAFDPARQFVPAGAQPREIDQSLAAFGFPKPLPFFDKDNVVQSLTVSRQIVPFTASTSAIRKASPASSTALSTKKILAPPPRPASSVFFSYRIYGHDKIEIRNAFIQYFTAIGWKMTNTGEDKPLLFSSNTRQIVSVDLLDAVAQGVDGSGITAAFLTQ